MQRNYLGSSQLEGLLHLEVTLTLTLDIVLEAQIFESFAPFASGTSVFKLAGERVARLVLTAA